MMEDEMSVTIIDYNQPEWLAEFNRRGKRIAELEHWGENKGEYIAKAKRSSNVW